MTVIFYDTFTDSDSTAITSHTPDTDTPGNGWVNLAIQGGTPSGGATVQSNQWSCSSDDQGTGTDVATADVTLDVDWITAVGANRNTVQIRHTDSDNCWDWLIREDNGDQILRKRVTASNSTLDSSAFSWSESTTYALKVVTSSNDIDTTIDGGSGLTNGGDSFNNTVTVFGLCRAAGSPGTRFDNFQIDDGAAPAAGPGRLSPASLGMGMRRYVEILGSGQS